MSGDESLSDSRTKAEEDARGKLAKQVSTSVSTTYSQIIRGELEDRLAGGTVESAGTEETLTKSVTETEADVRLTSAEIVDTYYDHRRRTHYALCAVSRSTLTRGLAAKARRHREAAAKCLAAARSAADARRVVLAVSHYFQTLAEAVQAVKPESVLSAMGGEKTESSAGALAADAVVELSDLLNSLQLKVLSDGEQVTTVGRLPSLRVKAVCEIGGEVVPVIGLPLAFTPIGAAPGGVQVRGPSKTDTNGETECHLVIAAGLEGSVAAVQVMPDFGWVPEMLRPLKHLLFPTTTYTCAVAGPMERLARLLADGLKRKAAADRQFRRIAVGNFTCEDTRVGGSMSPFLRASLAEALGRHFEVIDRDNLERMLRTQGFEVTHLVEASERALMADIGGLDAFVQGTFWPMGSGDVHVIASATYGRSRDKVSASARLPKEQVPSVGLRPDSPSVRRAQAAAAVRRTVKVVPRPEFDIRLSIDQGKEVYAGGETLVLRFKASRKCYLNLYNHNVKGEVRLIFPNEFHRDNYVKAGEEHKIPDEAAGFDFVARSPFGVEVIQAIASTEPLGFFQSPKALFASAEEFSGKVRSIVPVARDRRGRKAYRAEAHVIFTTVAQ